jgi:hypothetical protein
MFVSGNIFWHVALKIKKIKKKKTSWTLVHLSIDHHHHNKYSVRCIQMSQCVPRGFPYSVGGAEDASRVAHT